MGDHERRWEGRSGGGKCRGRRREPKEDITEVDEGEMLAL